MKKPLELDAAKAIALDLCHARGVILAINDPRRTAIVYALAAVHALGLGGWDLDHAKEYVTVTVPAVGTTLAGLVAALPLVGPVLASVAESQSQTTIYLSPAVARDPVLLLSVVAHELGHADQIAAGGIPWCLAYLVVPEVRAGAESACYGQDCAVMHALTGGNPREICDNALARLSGYGLDDNGMALARGVLDVARRTMEHGGEMGGPSHDVLEALRARGLL